MSFVLPRNIMFDLDGTLLDSLPGLCFSVEAAFSEVGLVTDTTGLAELVGPPIRTIISQLDPSLDVSQLDALERAFRRSYDSEGWRKTTCFAMASEIVRSMHHGGYQLFIVSNKPRHIAMSILDAEGISALFTAIVTRDGRRPHYLDKSEMILDVQSTYKLRPADCVMVGDTMEDAEASFATGTHFIFMSHGYGDLAEIEETKTVITLGHFSEFLPLIVGGFDK